MGVRFAIHPAKSYEIRLPCCPQSTHDDPHLRFQLSWRYSAT
jgi:hypothetical protein